MNRHVLARLITSSTYFLVCIFILVLHPAGVLADQPGDSIEFSSYAEMRERIGDLYSQQRYREAAEILEAHLDKFPEKLEANSFNLAYFYLLLEQYERCFDILEYALDQGIWFGTGYLDDAAWGPVKDRDRYMKIRARTESFRQVAQAAAKPELMVITPSESSSEMKYPLFIALHGGDGNMSEFKEVWKSDLLDEHFIVAFVQSSQVTSKTGFTWEDHALARKEIADTYRKIMEKYPVDAEEVVIGGFSSGGIAALDIMLSNTIPVSGFVALCPARYDTVFTDENVRRAKARGVRGTIIATAMDPGISTMKAIAELFRVEGLQYQFTVSPDIGHQMPGDISARIDLALNHIQNR